MPPGQAQQAEWPPRHRTEPLKEPHYPDVLVSVSWLSEHIKEEKVTVVDARPRRAYLAGHIPTAISLPSDSLPDPLALDGALGRRGLSVGRRIVCCGDSSHSSAAAYVFWMLEVAGAEDAALLEGGTTSWAGAGYDLETEENQPPPGTWDGEPNPDLAASFEYVKAKFWLSEITIIDTRGEEAWAGENLTWQSMIREGRGHIPNSLPFDFRCLLNADGTFLEASETREIFSRVGPRPSSPVKMDSEFLVHGSGVPGDGALGYFLLRRAGVESVRYYRGGWADWRGHSTSPIVRIVRAEELMGRLGPEGAGYVGDGTPRGMVLLDVRGKRDYDLGHIPGAVNLPSHKFEESLDAVLNRHWPGIDRRRVPLVTYCYGVDCIRSRTCATIAARRGFLNVERFRGGLREWIESGGEVRRGR